MRKQLKTKFKTKIIFKHVKQPKQVLFLINNLNKKVKQKIIKNRNRPTKKKT